MNELGMTNQDVAKLSGYKTRQVRAFFDNAGFGSESLVRISHAVGLRPIGPAYRGIKNELRPLFDVCGPEREIDLSNPTEPQKYSAPATRFGAGQ